MTRSTSEARRAARHAALVGFFRCTPFIISLVFFLSIILLGLSIEQAKRLGREPLSQDIGAERPSASSVLFYTSTAALLTTLYAPLDLALYLLSPMSALYALVSTPLLLTAWLVQVSLWTRCELAQVPALPAYQRRQTPTNPNIQLPGYCPQRGLATPQKYLQDGVQMAKVCLGWAIVALYMLYAVIAIVAVVRGRRERARILAAREKALEIEGHGRPRADTTDSDSSDRTLVEVYQPSQHGEKSWESNIKGSKSEMSDEEWDFKCRQVFGEGREFQNGWTATGQTKVVHELV